METKLILKSEEPTAAAFLIGNKTLGGIQSVNLYHDVSSFPELKLSLIPGYQVSIDVDVTHADTKNALVVIYSEKQVSVLWDHIILAGIQSIEIDIDLKKTNTVKIVGSKTFSRLPQMPEWINVSYV